jgi:ATP-dependent protease ClpP protease subunit
MKKSWYQFKAQAGDDVAELQIDDFIGSWDDEFFGTTEVTAKALVKQLSELPDSVKSILVHINSPGGDVFAAATIANALRAQIEKGRGVVTMVDGLAASAASVIMMAGQTVRVADNAIVMIHEPWSIAIGNSKEMRKTAETLDVIRDTIVAAYQWHSPLSEKELAALMEAETWMDADEAIANGFATEKVEGLKAAASIDPRAASKLKVPERFADRVAALLAKPVEDKVPPPPVVATADEIVKACRAAGLDLDFAAGLIDGGLTMEAVQARAGAEKETRAAEAKRQQDIHALGDRFKVPASLTEELVAGGVPFDRARAIVAAFRSETDKVEIDAGLQPDQGAGGKKVIDINAVYAQRNRLRN